MHVRNRSLGQYHSYDQVQVLSNNVDPLVYFIRDFKDLEDFLLLSIF